MAEERIVGRVESGTGDGQNWEKDRDLMPLIRQRTGFARLLAGALNVRVSKPRDYIRADHEVRRDENHDRHEDVRFERCRISRNGASVRALFIRTSTNFHGHSLLEFMDQYPLRK